MIRRCRRRPPDLSLSKPRLEKKYETRIKRNLSIEGNPGAFGGKKSGQTQEEIHFRAKAPSPYGGLVGTVKMAILTASTPKRVI